MGKSGAAERALVLQDHAEVLRDLIEKTNKERPRPEDVRALRQYLREHPETWKAAGDLIERAQDWILARLKASAAVKESLRVALTELPKELARQGDGRLEELLIEQVVTAWLRQGIAEYYYTERLESGMTDGRAGYWEQRLGQTQARYLRACEALARVRKLGRPGPVQLNIAERQMNIVQSVVSTPARDEQAETKILPE